MLPYQTGNNRLILLTDGSPKLGDAAMHLQELQQEYIMDVAVASTYRGVSSGFVASRYLQFDASRKTEYRKNFDKGSWFDGEYVFEGPVRVKYMEYYLSC